MSPKAVFRCLLTLSLLTEVAGIALTKATRDRLPPQLQEFVQAREAAVAHEVGLPLLAAMTVFQLAVIVGIIGLYRFWGPARALCLVALVLEMPLYGLVEEARAELVWKAALDRCSALLAGAVLAMSYCSPYRELFKSGLRREDAPASAAGHSEVAAEQ